MTPSISSKKGLLLGDGERVVTKVPGSIAPVGKYNHEKTRLTESSSMRELLESLDRERKLISNLKLLKRLPDKGVKIKGRIKSLEELVEKKKISAEEEAIKLMESLSLHNDPKIDVDALEWKNKTINDGDSIIGDSEDEKDSQDPLRLLASRELPPRHISPKEKLDPESTLNPHVINLSHKVDEIRQEQRFMPFASAHISEKETLKAAGSLTRTADPSKIRKPQDLMPIPSDLSRNHVQAISLSESLQIQIQKNEEFKELQIKRAAEKLSRFKIENAEDEDITIKDKMKYRSKEETDDQDEESESVDELATPEGLSEDEP